MKAKDMPLECWNHIFHQRACPVTCKRFPVCPRVDQERAEQRAA